MEKTRPSLTKDKVLAEQMIQSEAGYHWAAISSIFGGEVPFGNV
jgi:hypothetical protein